MKKIGYFAAILLSSVSLSQAATISITNFDTTYSAILTSTGLPAGGIVTVGTYTSEPNSAASALTGYTSLGTLAFGASSPGGTDGFVAGDINVSLLPGNPAIGQQVYVVIGNGATLETSTEFLVWKPTSNPAGNTYTADAPVGGPGTISLLGQNGQTLVGSFGTLYDAGLGAQASFQMAQVIPEPSTFLLGAVGALGLLRRRRI